MASTTRLSAAAPGTGRRRRISIAPDIGCLRAGEEMADDAEDGSQPQPNGPHAEPITLHSASAGRCGRGSCLQRLRGRQACSENACIRARIRLTVFAVLIAGTFLCVLPGMLPIEACRCRRAAQYVDLRDHAAGPWSAMMRRPRKMHAIPPRSFRCRPTARRRSDEIVDPIATIALNVMIGAARAEGGARASPLSRAR